MDINGSTKKALTCAFFCACHLILLSPAIAGTSTFQCDLDKSQAIDSAIVKYVHDGDTVRLMDNRKVRLIGIDTPELARKNKPAQPYAKEAKRALENLISADKNKVILVYGVEKYDRYGRTLAHLFRTDGVNIQSELVRNGFAIAYTTPPNIKYADCYSAAEDSSRIDKKGLWSHKRYATLQADMLDSDTNTDIDGFRIIEAKVNNISIKDKNIWLNLDKGIKIQVRKKDIQYFNPTNLKCYAGKTVNIRGWLHPEKDGFYLSLRHPSAIKLLDKKQC